MSSRLRLTCAWLCCAVTAASQLQYVDNTTVTAQQILSQDLQDFGLDKFKNYVRIAKAANLPLRISETNSL